MKRGRDLVLAGTLAMGLCGTLAAGQAPSQLTGPSLIESVYAKTKTAETVEDFSQIIDLCAKARASGLTTELEEYAKRLSSWSLNRRGELYAEQAATALQAGDKQRSRGLDSKALADFEQAVAYEPTRWKPLHNRGVSYALSGNYEKALSDFSRVVELKPDYANTWFNLGEIHSELGQLDQAVQDYARSIQLQPDDFGAVLGRGKAQLRLRRFAESLEDLRRAVALKPESVEACVNRGSAYQGLGMWEQAAADFRRANTLDKSSAQAYQAAAWLMATCPDERFRQAELAVQAAQQALQLAGNNGPRYLDTLAAAYANAGRFDEAVAALSKAKNAAESDQDRQAYETRLRQYRDRKPYRQERAATDRSQPKAAP